MSQSDDIRSALLRALNSPTGLENPWAVLFTWQMIYEALGYEDSDLLWTLSRLDNEVVAPESRAAVRQLWHQIQCQTYNID